MDTRTPDTVGSRSATTPRSQSERGLTWLTFGVLMLGGLIGTALLLPYALHLAGPLPFTGLTLVLLLASNVPQTLVLVAVAVAIGLLLGPRVGLGAPLLHRWLAGDPSAP